MRRKGPIAGRAGVALWACALFVFAASALAQEPGWPKSLKGHLLVAEPKLGDPNFNQTVVFMIAHDEEGAFGVVVNRSYGDVALGELMSGFGMEEPAPGKTVEVLYGGPVSPETGMVLHSSEYAIAGTQAITDAFSFTTNVRVLEDIAGGRGPRQSLLMMGYAGWAPGQLENEIRRGDWFWVPADTELVLDLPHHRKWQAAMDMRGVEL